MTIECGGRAVELSVLIFGLARPQQVVPFAGSVKWDAYSRLWLGQSTTLDAPQVAAWMSGLGLDVPVGFAVSLLPLKSPTQAAIEARSIAAISGHPVVAGFGPGSAELQQGVRGASYDRPLEAIEQYVHAMRILLGQAEPSPSSDGSSPASRQFPLPVGPLPPLHAPAVEIGLGVLRPNSAELAGAIADRAITWLLPAPYLRDVVVPRVRAGAGDREPPRTVAIVPFGLDRPGRDRDAMVAAALGRHLDEPHYRDAVRQAGIPIEGRSIARDVSIAAEGGLFAFGSVSDVSAQLAAYVDAGADEIVLNASGVAQTAGMKAALEDLDAVVNEMRGPNRS